MCPLTIEDVRGGDGGPNGCRKDGRRNEVDSGCRPAGSTATAGLENAQASPRAAKARRCVGAASSVLSSAPAASAGSATSSREKGVSIRLRAKEKVVPGAPAALGRMMPQPWMMLLLRAGKWGGWCKKVRLRSSGSQAGEPGHRSTGR